MSAITVRVAKVIVRLAREHSEFTADDVWLARELADIPPFTDDPRFLGGLMRMAASNGIIEMTDRHVPSIIPQCHSRPKRVWRSKIVRDETPTKEPAS